MTIAFLNPPFWATEPTTNPNEVRVRRGIRAGSRWPMTIPSDFAPDNFRIGSYVPYPMFLFSAAAYVKRGLPEADVILRDSIARGESYATFDSFWQETVPSHVIWETGAAALQHDLTYVRAMKRSNPKVQIAVGGPPARELSKNHDWVEAVDAFLLGEMEKPALRFANGERGVIGFDLLTREELAAVPFPLFDEACATHYFDSNPVGQRWPELTLWGSRGCWAVCNFCSFPATMTNDDPLGLGKRKIRFYKTEWMEAFIRERISVMAKAGTPLQSVRFDDDTGNSADKHTLEICAVMRRIGLPWSMMCRADTSSREVWKEMKDSGCFGVKIGFESASDRIVNQVVRKALDLKAAEETCRFLRSIGMQVHSTWMIGNLTETPEERKLTIDTIRRFYAENVHTSHQLSAAAQLEGTPLANAVNADPNYVRDPDGQHKIETLLRT